jgi:hypothetical protein
MLGPSVSSFLFEAFGGRPQKTTSFVRTDGTIATLRMAMDRHKLGIRSLLEVASERRLELLRDSYDRVQSAIGEAQRNSVRGVVIPATGPGVDPAKVRRLIERLTLQEVEVHRIEQSTRGRARDFILERDYTSAEFPAGSYVVDFVQPNARLARALLDPTLDFDRPLVEVPYDRRMPYYDAPWGNLPLLFGVHAFAVAGEPPGGISVDHVDIAPGVEDIDQSFAPYAWVLPAGLESSYRVAIQLLREDFRVRVFTDCFRLHGEWFPRGTFAVLRSRNPEGISERIRELAVQNDARLVGVQGPYTEAGLTFGDDRRVRPLQRPRVAVLADWPVNHDHTYGGIRSTLEGDFGFSFSPVMLETLNAADLSGYTAVVLPHAGMDVRGGPNFSSGYRGRLNLENLRGYVVNGGTLIAVQGAAELVTQDDVLGRGVSMDGWARYTEATLRAEWNSYEAPVEGEVVIWRPGLDRTGKHLFATGQERTEFAAPGSFPVLLSVADVYGGEVVARYSPDADRILLDGYMAEGDRTVLAGRPFVIVQPVGRGRVVYFAEDPTFRGAWYGMNLLFLNALMLGPVL